MTFEEWAAPLRYAATLRDAYLAGQASVEERVKELEQERDEAVRQWERFERMAGDNWAALKAQAGEPVAWQHRQRGLKEYEWQEWQTVGYKPQGPESQTFQMRPLFTHPTTERPYNPLNDYAVIPMNPTEPVKAQAREPRYICDQMPHPETVPCVYCQPLPTTERRVMEKEKNADAAEYRRQLDGCDREADRVRFPDLAFNQWLDEGISDAGHTVWDQLSNICDAWHGWINSALYTEPVKAQAGEPDFYVRRRPSPGYEVVSSSDPMAQPAYLHPTTERRVPPQVIYDTKTGEIRPLVSQERIAELEQELEFAKLILAERGLLGLLTP